VGYTKKILLNDLTTVISVSELELPIGSLPVPPLSGINSALSMKTGRGSNEVTENAVQLAD
jgi:hypothetical protein